MARYKFTMVEIVANEVEYEVEAEDEAAARKKAEAGDTLSEGHVRCLGVEKRQVWDGPKEVNEEPVGYRTVVG